jgi:hypothetical protein
LVTENYWAVTPIWAAVRLANSSRSVGVNCELAGLIGLACMGLA